MVMASRSDGETEHRESREVSPRKETGDLPSVPGPDIDTGEDSSDVGERFSLTSQNVTIAERMAQ